MNSDREKSILKKLAIATGILVVAFFITAWLTEETQEEKHDLEVIANRVESNLKKLESEALAAADTVLSLPGQVEMMYFLSHDVYESKGVTILVYENHTLLAWSGSDVTFASIETITGGGKKFIRLPNGWYQVLTRDRENRRAVAFISVYSEYSYQNKYLVNGFNPALQIPEGIALSDTGSKFVVRAVGGENLFGIQASASPVAEEKFPFSEALETSAIILLLFFFLFYGRLLLYRSFLTSLTLSVVIIIGRVTMVIYRFPEPLYQTPLFSPAYYASSFLFNSPGDLLFNILSVLVVLMIFFRHQKIIGFYESLKASLRAAIIHFAILSILLILVFTITQYYTSGLVINSKISFDLTNILELNGFSLLGFLMMALMMGFCFLVFRFAAEIIGRSFLDGKKKIRYTVFVLMFIFSILIMKIFPGTFPEFNITDFLFLAALIILTELIFIRKKFPAVSHSVIFLALFASYSSVLISEFNSRKQNENLMALARKLETARDPITEHLFQEIIPGLKADSVIVNMLADRRNDLALLRLRQIYFSDYWSKYNIAVTTTGDTITDNGLHTAEKLILEKGQVTVSSELFFIEDNPENISYIARFFPSEKMGVYVLFSEKFIQAEKGFPELYLSGFAGNSRSLDDLSFARYSNTRLISSHGSYPYPSVYGFTASKKEFELTHENSYKHVIYKPNGSTVVIVSKPAESALFPFTTFSYIISFYAFLALVIYSVMQWISAPETRHISLRLRVQVSIILIVLVSFTIIGWTTVNYVSHRYDKEIDERISEKITTAHHSMEKELPRQHMLADVLSDEKTLLLMRIASTLAADFNLYDLNGRLIFSSQPRLYQQGIISDRMQPYAFLEMAVKGKSQFIHPENIGGLNYIAAYEPVRNRNNETEGYIGLPYFQKQEELKQELSSFIGSLMNLYILLLAAALGAAYFISSRITRPLLVLKEKFGATRLGKRNEQIEWRRDDEIGNLVKQYNIMVDELEVSAELLARSEREMAWREMAKQVAHEIKNPLTPMKLNVQHLQKAMEENSPGLNELTKKVSRMLMEQIEVLTSIASSFSSFARMPYGRKEKVNLGAVIASVINLYRNDSAFQIIFNDGSAEHRVLADKEELSRMLGNLVKNAIQSIPEGKSGKIEIRIKEENTRCVVSISDNGAGIPAELQSKMFTPNFTTKSTGMGLGLAMVKSIAEGIGAKVWFDTDPGKGTTFFVDMPVVS